MSNFVFKQSQLVVCLPYLPRTMRSPTKKKGKRLLAYWKPGKQVIREQWEKTPNVKSTFSPVGIRKPLRWFQPYNTAGHHFQTRSHPDCENTKFFLEYEENIPALSSPNLVWKAPISAEKNTTAIKGSYCDHGAILLLTVTPETQHSMFNDDSGK